MAARLQLRNVRIAVRIVDELMVREVLQAIQLRRAEHRKHRENVRCQIVQQSVFKQDMMHALVCKATQLVLPDSDENQRQQPHENRPRPFDFTDPNRFKEPDGWCDYRSQEQIRLDEVDPVRPVVGLPKLLQIRFEFCIR